MSRPSNRFLAVGGALLALLVAAIVFAAAHSAPTAPGQGILGRGARPAIVGRQLDDGCFTGYTVQPAGRGADGTPHRMLTLRLKSDPADGQQLARLLDNPTCAGATRAALHAAGPGSLAVSYVTQSGARLLSP